MVAFLYSLFHLLVSTRLITSVVAFSSLDQRHIFTASKWNKQITPIGSSKLQHVTSSSSFSSSVTQLLASSSTSIDQNTVKEKLCSLLQSTPSNVPTPADLTQRILSTVKELEQATNNSEKDVLQELSGNWELLWTTQDKSSPESQQTLSWIK